MAIIDHKAGEAVQDSANSAIGGVVLASRNFHAIALEFAKMSLDSVDNATQVFDRFIKAKSWDQIIDIQTGFWKGHGGVTLVDAQE